MHLQLGDVLENHVDVVVEAKQCPTEFLVALHHDPYPGANTFVDEFCARETSSVSRSIQIYMIAESAVLILVAGVTQGFGQPPGVDTYRGAEVVTPWLLSWREKWREQADSG